MWLPTKYWLFLIVSLKNASVLRASNKVVSSDAEESSSRSPLREDLDRTTLVDYEILGPIHPRRGNGADEKFTFSKTSAVPHSEREDSSHKNSHGLLPSGESEASSRHDRGIGFYSNEMNNYVKNLLSKSLGGLLSSLSGKSDAMSSESPSELLANDSQNMEDVVTSESQSKLVIRVDSNEPEPEHGLVPVANSLLTKINKGLNYTSTISKYLTSIPAVRSLTSTFTGAVSSVQDYLKLIKPGTQWCGDGDRAKSFEDLGLFYKTDACCREHDKCPDFILSGEEKHGLLNDGVFTKLHCDCDVRFYQCLKSVHSPIALSTGFEYFNILKPTCFKKEYPVIGCNAFNKGKCVQYRLNSDHDKIWQWFENKEFL